MQYLSWTDSLVPEHQILRRQAPFLVASLGSSDHQYTALFSISINLNEKLLITISRKLKSFVAQIILLSRPKTGVAQICIIVIIVNHLINHLLFFTSDLEACFWAIRADDAWAIWRSCRLLSTRIACWSLTHLFIVLSLSFPVMKFLEESRHDFWWDDKDPEIEVW